MPIKQTTIQKLLPKQGYLIIELKKISNFQIGFDKLDISELSEKNVECLKKRDFQSTLFFNLFSEDEDLGQIFKSFETSPVYGKIGYEINFLKVFELKLNEAIIEYLKEKRGLAELRIYFDKNEYFTLGKTIFFFFFFSKFENFIPSLFFSLFLFSINFSFFRCM